SLRRWRCRGRASCRQLLQARCRFDGAAVLPCERYRGFNERNEQRMRPIRAGFELRVVLGAEIERVVGDLRDLDKPSVRREAREAHPVTLQQLPVRVVELETMTMALEDDWLSVRACGDRAGLEHARIAAEAHRSALIADVALFRQQVDHRVRRESVELG